MSTYTEVEFTLPRGYVGADGTSYHVGRMRLATALDEVEAVAHPRVQANEAYLPIVLLSRVVTQLGDIRTITPQVIEGLWAADLVYLEDLYLQLNSYEGVIVQARCPQCNAELSLRVVPQGGEA